MYYNNNKAKEKIWFSTLITRSSLPAPLRQNVSVAVYAVYFVHEESIDMFKYLEKWKAK